MCVVMALAADVLRRADAVSKRMERVRQLQLSRQASESFESPTVDNASGGCASDPYDKPATSQLIRGVLGCLKLVRLLPIHIHAMNLFQN